jgi:hypothetical protein
MRFGGRAVETHAVVQALGAHRFVAGAVPLVRAGRRPPAGAPPRLVHSDAISASANDHARRRVPAR